MLGPGLTVIHGGEHESVFLFVLVWITVVVLPSSCAAGV